MQKDSKNSATSFFTFKLNDKINFYKRYGLHREGYQKIEGK